MIECVTNLSEGRDRDLVAELAAAADPVLDVHRDGDHNRSVITTIGTDAPRRLTTAAVDRLSLARHSGAHPRIGVVDVVPFVPLGAATMGDAIAARDDFARWAADTLGLPCFVYGPERTLPDIRRSAFGGLTPDHGPPGPHPTAGGCAVGARPLMVAYNLWLSRPDIDLARRVAADIRGTEVRALGLQVGTEVQVSMNLIAPERVGPQQIFDAVARQADVARAELVGLVPEAVRAACDRSRWDELDLAGAKTIEARLAAVGLAGP